jgi:hypothetical protein
LTISIPECERGRFYYRQKQRTLPGGGIESCDSEADCSDADLAAVNIAFDAVTDVCFLRKIPDPPAQEMPIRATILFLAANPDGITKLALDKECRAIREKIRASEYPKALNLVTEWAVRADDLLQYLNEHRPKVVHFSGHGSSCEQLILHDAVDNPIPVSTAALKRLFSTLKDNIQLVVLNACYSRPQADAIVEIIDCAVGMNDAIGDEAAIVFAAAFYRALGFGRSVKEAFDQGCTARLLQGIPEEHTPELVVKKGVNVNRVFLAGPAMI